MIQDLHVRHRPKEFGEILGQEHIIKSIKSLFDINKVPHAFLLTGNSGVGKTTTARIIANKLGCKKVIEIDAATHTGVEDMRRLCESLEYPAMGESPLKVAIIDEAHRISKQGSEKLLKMVEEPPNHVYFIFATTEKSKIIKTIQSRCHTYNFKDAKPDDLFDLLDIVCDKENINLDASSLNLIAREAQGSPRRALVYLSECRTCENRREVSRTLETVEDASEVIELCRLIASGKFTWSKIMRVYGNLEENNPESIRIQIYRYVTSCAKKSKGGDTAGFLNLMEIFSRPIYSPTGDGDLILAFGEVCFGN